MFAWYFEGEKNVLFTQINSERVIATEICRSTLQKIYNVIHSLKFNNITEIRIVPSILKSVDFIFLLLPIKKITRVFFFFFCKVSLDELLNVFGTFLRWSF